VTPEQGAEAVSILCSRDGLLTVAILKGDRVFKIRNIAYGKDFGADFDHITTNAAPSIEALPIDVFDSSEILRLADEWGGYFSKFASAHHEKGKDARDHVGSYSKRLALKDESQFQLYRVTERLDVATPKDCYEWLCRLPSFSKRFLILSLSGSTASAV